jgi:hypothetical protein
MATCHGNAPGRAAEPPTIGCEIVVTDEIVTPVDSSLVAAGWSEGCDVQETANINIVEMSKVSFPNVILSIRALPRIVCLSGCCTPGIMTRHSDQVRWAALVLRLALKRNFKRKTVGHAEWHFRPACCSPAAQGSRQSPGSTRCCPARFPGILTYSPSNPVDWCSHGTVFPLH